MISLKLFDTEMEPAICEVVVKCNTMFKTDPKTTIGKTYYELWKSNTSIELLVWRNFYTDSRVQAFYNLEFELGLKAKKNILLQQVGENKSTATNQALISILKREEDTEIEADSGKIFVYSFIPLNQQEEHADNVKILENIPKEIRDALTIIDGDQEQET